MATVNGTNNGDVIDAADGVTDGNDTINGLGGNDTIFGLGGNDIINGGDGDDTIIGGAGADTIDGGTGNDTVSYSDSNVGVTVSLSFGHLGQGGTADGDSYSNIENVTGSSFNDDLQGNDSANVLSGGGGNDLFLSDLGADTILGGDGIDTMLYDGAAVNVSLLTGVASGGNAQGDILIGIENLTGTNLGDVLEGDNGANVLDGRQGADILRGGGGNDTLQGGIGNDILIGGAGADMLDGGANTDIDTASYADSAGAVIVNLATGTGSGGDAQGDTLIRIDNLIGSQFNDTLIGDANANRLDGGGGNDVLQGGDGNDVLNGGDGNDTITGGTGADTIDGGTGTDTVNYADSTVGVTVSLNFGHLGQGGTADGDSYSNIENVTGSAFDDDLGGNDSANVLSGGGGNDLFLSDLGADTIIGGDGIDTMLYDGAAVNVSLLTGVGHGGNAEGDHLVGIENLTGTALGDVLEGDNGANVLDGRQGDDILRGGAGADVLDGNIGNDTADYSNSADGVGIDLAQGVGIGGDAQGDTLISIENVIGSNSDDALVGNDLDNHLSGGGGADFLFGGAGNDVLDGGAGDDSFIGEAGADTIIGGAGFDTMDYGASTSGVIVHIGGQVSQGGDAEGDVLTGIEMVFATQFNDVVTGDDADNTFAGQGGDDVLFGFNGNDFLDGGDGNDLVEGGNGDDFLVGGAGADKLFGDAGIDTVYYGSSSEAVSVNLTTGIATGGEAEGDTFRGIENLIGSSHDDVLVGNATSNVIDGGRGTDTMTGGMGADTFVWHSTAETGATAAAADTVTDFNLAEGDKIDFSQFDANPTLAGQQHFSFVGTGAFTAAGQINWFTDGHDTFVQLNTDTDTAPEAMIRIQGVHTVDATWFNL